MIQRDDPNNPGGYLSYNEDDYPQPPPLTTSPEPTAKDPMIITIRELIEELQSIADREGPAVQPQIGVTTGAGGWVLLDIARVRVLRPGGSGAHAREPQILIETQPINRPIKPVS